MPLIEWQFQILIDIVQELTRTRPNQEPKRRLLPQSTINIQHPNKKIKKATHGLHQAKPKPTTNKTHTHDEQTHDKPTASKR